MFSRNETSFTRIMPDGKSEAISDFLDDFRKVRGDNCKDVVKDLATYFHKNIAYETLSRFETLRYHMCYRYGDNGLRAWIRVSMLYSKFHLFLLLLTFREKLV